MFWVKASGLVGALGVLLGAFGAHALRARLSAEMMSVFSTASLYHLVHAPVLLAIALHAKSTGSSARLTCSLFTAGITCFSGSLYLLATTGTRGLGAITPLGGLLLTAAWLSIPWTQ